MFKTIEVNLPGERFIGAKLKELSMKQLNDIGRVQTDEDTELDVMLRAMELMLVDEKGDLIINENYTAEQFASEIPQSYVVELSTAFSHINGTDEEAGIDLAKNS